MVGLGLALSQVIAHHFHAGSITPGSNSKWESYRVAEYTGDVEVYATLANEESSAPPELYLHLQDAGTPTYDGYKATWHTPGAGLNWLFIHRIDNGVATQLAFLEIQYPALTPRMGDVILFRRVGSNLELWHKTADTWSLLLGASDATYSHGKIGAGIDNGASNSYFDDFGGGQSGATLPPPSPPPPIPDAPVPSSPLLDNFNRPDEFPISQAGAWVPTDPRGSNKPLAVRSNQAGFADTGLSCGFSYRTQQFSGDVEVYATVTTQSELYGVSLAFNIKQDGSSNWDGYLLTWDAASDPKTDVLHIEKVVDNVVIEAFLDVASVEMASGDRFLARRVGTRLEGWVYQGQAWSKKVDAIDATYTGGKLGLYGCGHTTTGERYDNFGGGAFSPGPPLPGTPNPPVLDDFNRGNETPVSQGGNWSSTGLTGGAGAPLSQSKLKSFPQPGYSFRVRPYVGGSMEAAAKIVDKPNNGHWLSVFVCIQDAGTPGWDGYELRVTTLNGAADRWEVKRFDNGVPLPAPLAATDLEIIAGGTMLLRKQGIGQLQVWWKPPGGAWTRLLEDEISLYDLMYQRGMIGAGGYKTGSLDDYSGGSLLTPLEQYAPEIRHSAFDTYRAASPAMMTDNVNQAGVPNQLIVGGSPIAAPGGAGGLDVLSLSYLGLAYPPNGLGNGQQSADTDYLDAVDSTRTEDAQRMQGNPLYASKVYAREKAESGGKTTLQYWIFYYFNWHPSPPPFGGDHEGDWEMVQYELDALGVPTRAAYSQHDRGETCIWSKVERNTTGRPIVYSARGSHASYFKQGDKPASAIPLRPGDNADGNAAPVVPTVQGISPEPPWLLWRGRWGEGGAPGGPKTQGSKWDTPADWADNADSCWEVPFSARRATAASSNAELTAKPPAPTIRATRIDGRRVRIAYSFQTWPTGVRRPVLLLTSVQSSGTRYAPYMKRHRISARSGVVFQPLGLGKAPFKVYAASYSREGVSSSTVMTRLRSG